MIEIPCRKVQVGITGSRDWTDRELLFRLLEDAHAQSPCAIYHIGDCNIGAEAFAREWAIRQERIYIVYYAKWETQGRAAGPLRDQKIVNASDRIIAFVSEGQSRKTEDIIRRAKMRNLPVREEHQVMPLSMT